MYKKNKIHFVGIGGIGMSGIAEVLLNLGYQVSGSDLRQSGLTDRLASLGGSIHIGHDAEWCRGADVVVTSSAVRADNPEVVAAREAHIPVIPRAEMLGELMRLTKYGIAVAGSHGKTTTTSLVGWVLAQAGLDPTVIIGGQVNSFGGSNAKLGAGDFLVAEADESDGSFLKLSPVLEVVTNIDLEHLDYYRDLEHIKSTFTEFINKLPFYGAAILCLDDPQVAAILPAIGKRVITYGLSSQANIHARAIRSSELTTRFEVWTEERRLGEIHSALAGTHNVYNALACVTVGLELDIPFATISAALENFSGVQRRLQVKGERKHILVIDDYGHHPTEIRATLSALRGAWPDRRQVVLFQPHRYSRTKGLFDEFCTAFHGADILLVTEIYSAGENPIPGITAEELVAGIKRHGHRNASYAATPDDLVEQALTLCRPRDILLTLGAGNIWRTGEKLLLELQDLP
ncbi:MAG: UDP-N-acetylmuramate--L-alanine ligase [Deltaproteobacteria bacterium RIFOXYD12_FULL_57_12]|nr:MAG: UDP-N-acetylmuramate--L-alanine ligase [Deltaproteobacteria bacterium RIFOXYD12_FULL_57_12]